MPKAARKRRYGHYILLALYFVFAEHAFAQSDTISPRVEANQSKSILLPSIAPAIVIGVALYNNYHDFWKNAEKVPFHFSNDPPYAMHNDKFGHAYYAATTADIIKLCYAEAGMERKTAAWIGFGSSLLAQTLVEIGDAFHGSTAYYGFSPGDEVADILGSSFSLMKEYIPGLSRFDYKVGFWPSSAYKEGAYHTIIDDDESEFFWMSYQIYHDLPEGFPKWLNIGIGYGVQNLLQVQSLPDRKGTIPASQVYLGLDINLKGLPIEGKAWEIIAGLLDHFRIPFPALQVSPVVKWYWLHS
ncbi:MAG: DUF2279 domain-containing protein [Bacteroidota bacterium]|nr:DUF2279 domain-containing protein [Bacteroidota bacterium]